MLQYLLQQWIRQQAQQQFMQAVSSATRERSGEAPAEPEDDLPTTPCQVAILFALNIEAAGVLDGALDLYTTRNATFIEHVGPWKSRQVCVAEVGVGRQLAAQATADVIALHQPQWVISAGFAGALVDDMPRGHLLMADPIVDQHGQELSVGFKISAETLAQSPKLHVGKLLTVDAVVKTPTEKRALAAAHGAVACDMETAAVAEACRAARTRFLSVRIISDGVDDELPPEIERLMQSKTLAQQLGAATGAIFKRPSAIKDLWQLRENAIRYSDRLAKFLAGVVPQLR
jgi:adenosylhomocysteine nucleosidase